MGIKASGHLPLYRVRIFFGLLLFALMQPLQAAVLGLLPSFPDFAISNQGLEYDADCDGTFAGDCNVGQGKLTISNNSASLFSYTEVGAGGSLVNQQVNNATFSLTAILDQVSGAVVSGSFILSGQVLDNFPPVPPAVLYDGTTHPNGLLSGDLLLFGFSGNVAPSSGGILEFTFGNASGYIADADHPLIELGNVIYNGGGMILSVTDSTLGAGNFGTNLLTTDWTSTTGFGDVFVPIPAAVWLFGSGLAVLLGFGSKRKLRSRGVS